MVSSRCLMFLLLSAPNRKMTILCIEIDLRMWVSKSNHKVTKPVRVSKFLSDTDYEGTLITIALHLSFMRNERKS